VLPVVWVDPAADLLELPVPVVNRVKDKAPFEDIFSDHKAIFSCRWHLFLERGGEDYPSLGIKPA